MGAEQVIAIDHHPHRLRLAEGLGAKIIDYSQTHVAEALMEMTGGIGPDAVIDAVGMESHGLAPDRLMDRAKQAIGLGVDGIHVLRAAIHACRKGGRVSVPGVYGGFSDNFPTGAIMQKGLTLRSGQTHVQRYMPSLLHRIAEGEIDTTFLISHRLPLEDAVSGYKNFRDDQNAWTKVVLKTPASREARPIRNDAV
jgi:threonine dehydrogenase-like Zn-dependent dehydrogenase